MGGCHGWSAIGLALCEKGGITLVIFGLLEVFVHLPDINAYFLDRVRDSIIEDEYLSRLAESALEGLVGRAFKAQFGVSDALVGKEGRMLPQTGVAWRCVRLPPAAA